MEALDSRPKKRKKVVKRTQAGAVEIARCCEFCNPWSNPKEMVVDPYL